MAYIKRAMTYREPTNNLPNLNVIDNLLSSLQLAENKDSMVINLTANENIVSKCASKYYSSIWANRYHLGVQNDYANATEFVEKGGLVFRGLPAVYALEKQAIIYAQSLFNAPKLETRYLSGVHAVISNITMLMKRDSLVMSLDPGNGGHFASRNLVQYLGGRSKFLPYDIQTQTIDIPRLKVQMRVEQPDIVLIDQGVTLFPLNLQQLREVCGPRTNIIYDASHTLGLIAGKVFPNPLSNGCNLVQGNTHKSFPGPHKALAYWSDKSFDVLRDGLDCAFVSSQNTHQSIALYISILEMGFYGVIYANKMINNAQIFAEQLLANEMDVMRFRGEFTQTNVLLLRLPSADIAKRLCVLLQKYNISSNARVIFGIPTLRLGVQEVTRKGMGSSELKIIAKIFKKSLDQVNAGCDEVLESTASEVQELMESAREIKFSFDSRYKL